MSRGTKLRSIRVDDELWVAAQLAAAGRGESVSDLIRRTLGEYVTSWEERHIELDDEWVDPDPDATAARLDAELLQQR